MKASAAERERYRLRLWIGGPITIDRQGMMCTVLATADTWDMSVAESPGFGPNPKPF